MKLFIAAFILSFVFCDGCEEFLPVECAEGEIACPGGVDSDGCPWPGYCTKAWKPYFSDVVGDTVYCPNFCEKGCKETEKWCDNGKDEVGCWLEMSCVPNEDGLAECPPVGEPAPKPKPKGKGKPKPKPKGKGKQGKPKPKPKGKGKPKPKPKQ